MANAIIDIFDLWTTAQNLKTSNRGLSASNQSLLGIKKLRELILELAVSGKLVSQEPQDEPANILLKKIEAEKKRLVKEGKIKKQEVFAEVDANEKPTELPENWIWTRLGIISIINPRNEHRDDSLASFVPMTLITTSHTGKHGQNESSWGDIKNGFTHFANGDIGLAKITPCFENSKAVVFSDLINGFGAGTTELHIARIVGNTLYNRYVLLYLKSPQFLLLGETKMTGTAGQKRVPRSFFAENPFPLPPLAEQHRIVAKVDELMALCDQLEQQQTNSNKAHQTLVDTLLGTLTNAENHAAFEEAWRRISNHFDTLLTTEHSIDQLKQTILQLAVMGKLVTQYPDDEPASELLKKLEKEKARLVKEWKIKKQASLPEIANKEKPFELPKGWKWIKFGELSRFINGDRSKNYPNQREYVEKGVAWINTGHIEPTGKLTTVDMNYISREKFDSLRSGKIQFGDLVYCLRGATFGKTAFVEPYVEGAIASSLMIIRPYSVDLKFFIFLYLISPLAKKQLSRFDNGSAQPNLSANSVLHYAFPLPPLAEQQRIVSKVNELFALCDTLKNRLRDAQALQNQLAFAVLEQAV